MTNKASQVERAQLRLRRIELRLREALIVVNDLKAERRTAEDQLARLTDPLSVGQREV